VVSSLESVSNGLKAVVLGRQPGNCETPWVGYETIFPDNHTRICSWSDYGESSSMNSRPASDLISTWTYPIAPGHNPNLLTVEQVGEGWWLPEWGVLEKLSGEQKKAHFQGWSQNEPDQWSSFMTRWPISEACTYRTRLTREELLKLIAPKKRLIRVEELPPVCWVGCSDCCSLVTRRSEDKIGFPHSPDMSIRELHCDQGDKWSSDLRTWNSFEVEDGQ